MDRVVVVNFVSIDGVIQSPLSPEEDRDGGFAHGGWVPPRSDDVVNAFMQDATVGASGLLLGRRSYEILRGAWAHADDSEPAVAAMTQMPKYVVTSSPGPLEWENSHRVDGDFVAGIRGVKERSPGDLVVFGAATLIHGLAEHDLVDEYRLLLFPVVLGGGKRMFDDRGAFARFTLTDTVPSPSGVVILTYIRDRSA